MHQYVIFTAKKLNYFYTKIVTAQPTDQTTISKMLFSIILVILPLVTNGFMFTSKKNDFSKKQKEYTRKLLETDEIRITDRIVYNKDVTYSFFLKLCPSITEGLIDYHSEYHLLKNISKENFERNITEDVAEIFMESIYTSKNYPSYHDYVTLNIDMNDIITYHELHCNAEEYAVNNTYMMDMKKQMVYKEKTKKIKEIDINFTPTYEMVHQDYNEVLCPFVQKYMEAKIHNTSDTYQLEYDIYDKFIDDIYTPSHYGNIYNPIVSVSKITYNDAKTYWENHCMKNNANKYTTTLFYSIVTFTSIVGVFCLYVIIYMTMNLAYFYKQKHRYSGTKNE